MSLAAECGPRQALNCLDPLRPDRCDQIAATKPLRPNRWALTAASKPLRL